MTGTPLSRGWAGTAARSTEGTGSARTPSGRPWNCREAAGTPPGHEQRKRRLRSPGPPSTEHCGDPGGRSVERRVRSRGQPLPPHPSSPPIRAFAPTLLHLEPARRRHPGPILLPPSSLSQKRPGRAGSCSPTDGLSFPRRLHLGTDFFPRKHNPSHRVTLGLQPDVCALLLLPVPSERQLAHF